MVMSVQEGHHRKTQERFLSWVVGCGGWEEACSHTANLNKVVWSNHYFTLSDNPRRNHLTIRVKPKYTSEGYMGQVAANSKSFMPRLYDEPRHFAPVCQLLCRAWAIWRMRQGTFLQNNPYRVAFVDTEVGTKCAKIADYFDLCSQMAFSGCHFVVFCKHGLGNLCEPTVVDDRVYELHFEWNV